MVGMGERKQASAKDLIVSAIQSSESLSPRHSGGNSTFGSSARSEVEQSEDVAGDSVRPPRISLAKFLEDEPPEGARIGTMSFMDILYRCLPKQDHLPHLLSPRHSLFRCKSFFLMTPLQVGDICPLYL